MYDFYTEDLNPFNGMELIEDMSLVDSIQYRFPEYNKKSWRKTKKFKKRYSRFEPSERIVMIGNKLIFHPIMKNEIMKCF